MLPCAPPRVANGAPETLPPYLLDREDIPELAEDDEMMLCCRGMGTVILNQLHAAKHVKVLKVRGGCRWVVA